MSKTKARPSRLPRILVTAEDLEILETMIGRATSPGAAMSLLEAELARAVVIDGASSRSKFCRIGSWVTYEDQTSGQTRTLQLVLPADANIEQRRVSILSLVGVALLGLVADAEFGWTDDSGRPHRLKVIAVADEDTLPAAPVAHPTTQAVQSASAL